MANHVLMVQGFHTIIPTVHIGMKVDDDPLGINFFFMSARCF